MRDFSFPDSLHLCLSRAVLFLLQVMVDMVEICEQGHWPLVLLVSLDMF